MKKLLKKLMYCSLLLIFLGCSDNVNDEMPFGDYQIDNVSSIDLNTVKERNVLPQFDDNKTGITKVAFYGLKNNRIWFAIFDKATKKQLIEYCFEKEVPHTISLPYGEHFDVVDWSLTFNEYGNLIVVDGSYSNVKLTNEGVYSSDSFIAFSAPAFMNNEFVSLVDGLIYPFWCGDSHILKLENGFILIKNDGSSIYLKKSPSYNSDYIQVPITETMTFHNALNVIHILNLITGDKVEIVIEELDEFVKKKETDWNHITLTPQSLIGEQYVEVHCHITFKSGAEKVYMIKICLSNETYTWIESK